MRNSQRRLMSHTKNKQWTLHNRRHNRRHNQRHTYIDSSWAYNSVHTCIPLLAMHSPEETMQNNNGNSMKETAAASQNTTVNAAADATAAGCIVLPGFRRGHAHIWLVFSMCISIPLLSTYRVGLVNVLFVLISHLWIRDTNGDGGMSADKPE